MLLHDGQKQIEKGHLSGYLIPGKYKQLQFLSANFNNMLGVQHLFF